jgi:hypothetical protein
VRKGCQIAAWLRELGVRPYGVVRIDTACGVEEWDQDPIGNTRRIAATLREACQVAEGFGEKLAAEGEICWGGLHSWKKTQQLLEMVGRPKLLGFQADMAHTLLYTLGYNAPEDAILPPNWDWSDPARLDAALATLTAALRPWTLDFHVAQNDATVKGSGTHDKTGRHCLPTDPNGKLDITRHAGYWLRDETGKLTRATRHVCWDGCMFPNSTMTNPQTWRDILTAMVAVREAHGWKESKADPTSQKSVAALAKPPAIIVKVSRKASKVAGKKPKALKAKPSKRRETMPAKKTAKKATAKKTVKQAPAKAKAKKPAKKK